MNVERLHHILHTVHQDIEEMALIPALDELIHELNALVSAPQEPTHQQKVMNSRAKVLEILTKSASHAYPPSWIRLLDEMYLALLVAPILSNEIEGAFIGHDIAPAVIKEQIEKIIRNIKTNTSRIDQLIAGFSALNFGRESLKPGEAEVSVGIPQEAIDSDLNTFGDEVLIIDKTFAPFVELVSGQRHNLKIKSISSSDFIVTFYVANELLIIGAATVTAVAFATRQVILAYKEIRDLRDMKEKLAEVQAPKNISDDIDKFAADKIKKIIEETVSKLLKDYGKIKDKGRENEVRNELEIGLTRIARRLDKGYTVETRMEKPPEPEKGEEVSDEDAELVQYHEVVRVAHAEQTKFKPSGEPILALTEPEDDPEPE